MKRDLNLIRQILLTIEESDSNTRIMVHSFDTDKYGFEMISLHIQLLLDCNYIEAKQISYLGMAAPDFIVSRITSFGYDYLDSVRNDTVWSKTRDKLSEVGGSAALDVVKGLASSIAMNMLGI